MKTIQYQDSSLLAFTTLIVLLTLLLLPIMQLILQQWLQIVGELLFSVETAISQYYGSY